MILVRGVMGDGGGWNGVEVFRRGLGGGCAEINPVDELTSLPCTTALAELQYLHSAWRCAISGGHAGDFEPMNASAVLNESLSVLRTSFRLPRAVHHSVLANPL